MDHTPRNPAQRKTFGDAIARRHNVTIRVSASIPAGVWGYAVTQTRTIVVPPDWFQSDQGFAGLLHEIGHLVSGPCLRKEPHRRDVTERYWWHCLACETEAWHIAMTRLAPEFSRAQFELLKASLAIYRQKTPASRAAVIAAKQLASDSYYARLTRARMERDIRLSQWNEIQTIARSPRVLSRWERQYQEIQRIAREAQYEGTRIR